MGEDNIIFLTPDTGENVPITFELGFEWENDNEPAEIPRRSTRNTPGPSRRDILSSDSSD